MLNLDIFQREPMLSVSFSAHDSPHVFSPLGDDLPHLLFPSQLTFFLYLSSRRKMERVNICFLLLL